jgi:hypothetical protein
MPGYTAAAFVRLLELQEAQAIAYQNLVRARLAPIEYELMQAAAELRVLRQVLAEARVLAQAITDRKEWFIQPDGTVKTEKAPIIFSTTIQDTLL